MSDQRRRGRGFVRRALNRAGIEISRDPYLKRVVRLMELLETDTVIDVGANEGQFGRDLRALGFDGRILSFEPLSGPYDRLVKATAHDKRWTAFQAAVSDGPGPINIHIARNSVSSSALPMMDAHLNADPSSTYVGQETVPATTVDAIVADYHVDPGASYLKVDVQGLESSVLDGAPSTLQSFAAVQLEVSLVPLYAGQSLMDDLVSRMGKHGFEMWILMPEFSDRLTGRTLQCDSVFVRQDLIDEKLRCS